MKKRRYTFIVKEISLVKYAYVVAVFILYSIILLMYMMKGTVIPIEGFYSFSETALIICLSFMCSEILNGQSDLNIILSSIKSRLQYVISKYLINLIIILITFFIMSILLVMLKFDLKNIETWEKVLHIWSDLIPTFISTSSLVVLGSLMLRSKMGSYGVGFILTICQITLGINLAANHTNNYGWLITSFHTIYIKNSKVWYTNKIMYLLFSLLLWGVIYYQLKYSKKDIVGIDE